MNFPRVSIILPSYNSIKYMEKCLASVQQQSLDNIEIICVDYGSTDGTLEFIQETAKTDSRIRVIISDLNSYGHKINLGIKAARGKYIGIVETDDYIKPEMMEVLYALAEGNNLDYIKADYSMFIEKNGVRVTADHIESMRPLKEILGEVIDPCDYPMLLFLDCRIWKGIYRRDFIVDNDLWLNETLGAAYQDNGFMHKTITRAHRVMYIPDCFYQYRRDNENASDYSPKLFERMAEEYSFVEQDRCRHTKEYEPFIHVYYMKMWNICVGAIKQQKMPGAYFCLVKYIQRYYDWISSAFINGKLETLKNEQYGNTYWDILRFLEHPQTYIESDYFGDQNRCKALTEYLNDIEERLESRNPDGVVVVSSGDRGTAQYMLLAKNLETTDIYICDNSKCQQGKDFGYHKVESVEEAVKNHPKAYYVITNEFHHRELKEQIKELGIEEEDIIEFDIPNWIHFASMWTRS